MYRLLEGVKFSLPKHWGDEPPKASISDQKGLLFHNVICRKLARLLKSHKLPTINPNQRTYLPIAKQMNQTSCKAFPSRYAAVVHYQRKPNCWVNDLNLITTSTGKSGHFLLLCYQELVCTRTCKHFLKDLVCPVRYNNFICMCLSVYFYANRVWRKNILHRPQYIVES